VSVRLARPIVTTVIVIERIERVEKEEDEVSSSEKDLGVKLGVVVGGGRTEYLNTLKCR
jgi:uridylate kinase